MCQKESWEAIFATTEAHSTQRGQPPRMHGSGLWMYEQKEQRVTPVPMIGVNCNLWCPGWDGKDLGGSNHLTFIYVCMQGCRRSRMAFRHLVFSRNVRSGTYCQISWNTLY